MREANLAFKKRLQESRLRTARRLTLQRAGIVLALGTSLILLYLHYLG